MALINCPECNKQISDKATSCPNCGFPVKSNPDNQQKTDGTYNVILLNAYHRRVMVIAYIQKALNLELGESRALVNAAPQIVIENVDLDKANEIHKNLCALGASCIIEEYKGNREKNDIKEEYKEEIEAMHKEKINTILCPRCNSSSVVIGTRGYKLLTGFLGSGKTTNRCGNCGYTWQPLQ